MTGLEIIFITSVLLMLIIWIWFIIQGFQTSRAWGASLIFLFPLSPFMFAYRFERKTRKSISYFLGCLVFFIATLLYIHFATIDFFPTLARKLGSAMPRLDFSGKPKDVKTLNLPPPTPIPPPRTVEPAIQPIETVITAPSSLPEPTRRYQTISIDSAKNYLGKNVIISTATVVHRGKLMSASGSQIEIKKEIGGGSTIMGISKNKITKIEVN